MAQLTGNGTYSQKSNPQLWIHLDTQMLYSKQVNYMNHISIKLFLNRGKAKMKAKSFDSWLSLKS